MSRYYELAKDTNFLTLNWKSQEDSDYLLENIHIGKFAEPPLHNISVEFGINDDEDDRGMDDYPCLSAYIPAFSERFVDVFRKVLLESGQLFYIYGEDRFFYLYNVTHFEDLIDHENSSVVYFEGNIIDIRKLILKNQDVQKPIFKLTGDPRGPIYVTNAFKEEIEAQGFLGFRFKPVA